MGDREQAFERHPKLARWIEKLANRRIEGFSHASWCAFLSEINTALDAEAGPPEREGWVLGVKGIVAYDLDAHTVTLVMDGEGAIRPVVQALPPANRTPVEE